MTVLPRHAGGGPVPPEADLGRVHFVGIGGAGMSGIARIMLARGIEVSGSDAKESDAVHALRALGARVEVGHAVGHLGGADTVVVSTAIRDSNPELVAARERRLRVLARAEALSAVMSGQRGVAVAGTHGKTSTTSMLVVALQRCGVDPSFAIGGELNESGSNAHHGSGGVFVAEADESDGSFLLLAPYAAIVTNVEADHLDTYGTESAVVEAFGEFVGSVDPGGFLVLFRDDATAWALAEPARARGVRVRGYGESPDADLRLCDLSVDATSSRYRVTVDGADLGAVTVGVPGRHMALNSAAALLTGLELGLPHADLAAGLAAYGGVRRRFEFKGVAGGVRVYDDYAHHPTEITAQLRAARTVAGDGRVIACFQPHLFSRTRAFAGSFGRALGLADEVVVMDVYAAREDPVPGVTGASVASAVPLPAERVHFEPSWSATAGVLADRAGAGDLVLTLGAGDVTMVGPEVLTLLDERGGARADGVSEAG